MPASLATRLLIVDDDEAFREALVQQLILQEDFTIQEAGTAMAGIALARQDRFSAIILDVGLPDMDGRDACRLLRKHGVDVPIVMLTAMDGDADQILGLDSGANDYLTKPFRLNVLLARLRTQLRQHLRSSDAVFSLGPYEFRPNLKVLVRTDDGRRIPLTDKETQMLRLLYRHLDRPTDRNVLLREVWGYSSEASTHTIETHIYRLRQKIEPDPGAPSLLVTEAGGYRLNPSL